MKKILAYLLVLVSLMTLFCGTASAEITFSKKGSAGVYADIVMTNLDSGATETRRTRVATLNVTATCRYEGNNPIYPVAAWASSVNTEVTSAGGSVVRVGQPYETTYTGYEGGKRSLVEHCYYATLKATYAPRGSMGVDEKGQIVYLYGSKTETATQNLSTKIQFYRR